MKQDTRDALLSEAEELMRTRGYAAFSYADLATKVAIRKASIHYHFPTKEALGLTVVGNYLENFEKNLTAIKSDQGDVIERLKAYAQFFALSVKSDCLPLCGALAAESRSLPESMRERTRDFFRLHVNWLTDVVAEGVSAGTLKADIDPRQVALLILSVLEGASLVGWVLDDAPVGPTLEAVLDSLRR